MRGHNTTLPDSSDSLLFCRNKVAESLMTTLNQILYFILTWLMAHSLSAKCSGYHINAVIGYPPSEGKYRLQNSSRKAQGVSSAQVHMDFHPPSCRCKYCSCTHSTSCRGELPKHLWKAGWCASLHQRTEFRFCIVKFCPYECPM